MREGWIVSTRCAQGAGDFILARRGLAFTGDPNTLEKRWIADGRVWTILGITRSMLHLVTPAQLASMPDGPRIYSGPIGAGRGTLPGFMVYGLPGLVNKSRGDC
jgi:hypothetical protein